MVATDSEIMSHGDHVDPALHSGDQHQSKNQTFPSLGRQSSIYSLTLDEFQHALCESGKNFGSMNMDEFLNSIWTAEENQAQAQAQGTTATATSTNTNADQFTPADNKGLTKQPSLPRQGSLTIPEPLCRKTVDEVWSEIHKVHNNDNNTQSHAQNPNTTAQKQATFGEMTLEDFLVRAGVVREQQNFPPAPPQQPSPYGLFQNNPMATNFVPRPIMAIGGGVGGVGGPTGGVNNGGPFSGLPQSGVGEATAGYPGGMKRGGGYSQPPATVSYGGRLGNGSGGGFGQGLGIGSPVSPGSSDGLANQVDSGNQYGLDMGGSRGGRKRIIDGPVEKVVERRQRRMIKNRESAARSRARKQAYTVELEAELNQLKEENAHLKQALAELERKRKQQYYEEARVKAQAQMQSKAQKATKKLQAIRRSLSGPY